ncbi:MAG TPA: hypothetical protein VFC78_11545 [Tepidisphaeraceae bacterium]|nr:hypothetical protein [Tepidisphaeraceae bacterium]
MRRLDFENLLIRKLGLAKPRFKIRKIGNQFAGSIISDTFKRKTDSVRQNMIWDALEDEFGTQAMKMAGTLLAYTNDEWDMDFPAKAG